MAVYKNSVLDVTKPDFDVDAFLCCQLKDKTLDDLVKEEQEMISSVRRLDSDVHQLVYENYNKFLTATSTVRKLQDEFDLLDNEMDSLSSSMKNISGLIDELGGVLGGPREDIVQLGNSYKVVKSLQFIFDLPDALLGYYEDRRLNDVVRIYLLARGVLTKFEDVENVSEIMKKISAVIADTKTELLKMIEGNIENVEDVAMSIDLLLKLDNDPVMLQNLLLNAIEKSLRGDLDLLKNDPADVLDLVDRGCGSFIPNLTLLASLHEKIFPSASDKLLEMLQIQLSAFHDIVSHLFLSSADPKDCSIVVRALDRYYRKMSTCSHVVKGLDCSSSSISLIRDISLHEIYISRLRIREEVGRVLQQVRKSLLTSSCDLPAQSAKLEQAFIFQVKTALANLLLFTASDVTFSSLPPEDFKSEFARNVHENLLIAALKDLIDLSENFGRADGERRCLNPLLFLVFAVALHHLFNKSAPYLMNLCREQFSLMEPTQLTSLSEITLLLKARAQSLLQSYANERGVELGETLIRGYGGTEQPISAPTGVRAAVRRAVDEVSECEDVLSLLFGGEQRKEGRTRRAPDTPRDSLWCDRIDFHQPIHFNKSSVITTIVKILLKSLIECIRLQTYNKSAVEQIQVDCCYLQRCLSPLVADEVVVNSMVDQALSSALKRCLDPVLIHPSKLAHLCEEKEPCLETS